MEYPGEKYKSSFIVYKLEKIANISTNASKNSIPSSLIIVLYYYAVSQFEITLKKKKIWIHNAQFLVRLLLSSWAMWSIGFLLFFTNKKKYYCDQSFDIVI